MPASKARRASTLAWAYFAAVVVCYTVVILLAKLPPPTVDYPDWVYQGVLLHARFLGHPIAGYTLKHYPVPNSTTTVALGLLDCVMPWAWAAKVWVCAYLLLALACSRALARAISYETADWRMIVVLPTVAFLNLDFWWGHISFELGLCLLLLLLAMLLEGRSVPKLALLLTAMFFTHMEACACGLLLLAVWTVRDRRWPRLLAALPAGLLTVWYAAGRYGSGTVDGASLPSAYRWGSRAFLVFKANTFFKIFGYVNARSVEGGSVAEGIFGRGLFLALLVAGCVLALLCLWLALNCERTSWRGSVYWFSLPLMGLALLLPHSALGVADPGSRLLLAACVLAFFATGWQSRAGTAAALLSMVLCAANLVQFARVEAQPRQQGSRKDLPAAMLTFGHVEPAERLGLYLSLDAGRMDQAVFETGLYRMAGH